MLAVDADNAAALPVYRASGMDDSGSIFEWCNGCEHRYTLSLKYWLIASGSGPGVSRTVRYRHSDDRFGAISIEEYLYVNYFGSA